MTGAEFRAWRKRLKWTQADTAVLLELSKSTIEGYERGYRREKGRPAVKIPHVVVLATKYLDATLLGIKT